MISIKEILDKGGFDFNGVWITDIFYDESGRFEVDPREYYNINFTL